MFTTRRSFCSTAISCARKRPTPLSPSMDQGANPLADMRQEITRREESRHNAAKIIPSTTPGTFSNSELTQYEPSIGQHGRIYSPEDLSFDAKRPLQREVRLANTIDQFEHYQINPIDEYKSYNLLSSFTTELGRIKTREQTGLSAKHQRQLGKTIRRARALALLPTTAKHPESIIPTGRRAPSLNWIRRSN